MSSKETALLQLFKILREMFSLWSMMKFMNNLIFFLIIQLGKFAIWKGDALPWIRKVSTMHVFERPRFDLSNATRGVAHVAIVWRVFKFALWLVRWHVDVSLERWRQGDEEESKKEKKIDICIKQRNGSPQKSYYDSPFSKCNQRKLPILNVNRRDAIIMLLRNCCANENLQETTFIMSEFDFWTGNQKHSVAFKRWNVINFFPPSRNVFLYTKILSINHRWC